MNGRKTYANVKKYMNVKNYENVKKYTSNKNHTNVKKYIYDLCMGISKSI